MDRKDPKTRKPIFKVERTRLPIGDIIFNKRIVVEHKEASDFLNSIPDKRIQKQVNNMVSTYGKENCYLLVVGDIIQKHQYYSEISLNSVFGMIRWCSQNINVYNSCKKTSAVEWLKNLGKYSAKDDTVGRPTPVINKPRYDSISQCQLGLMQIIPDIGYSTSRKFLLEYDSPMNFFEAILSDKLDTSTDAKKEKVNRWKAILTDKFEGDKE